MGTKLNNISIQFTTTFTGEKLTKEEAKGLMNELCDPEDAEGFTPFMRKLTFSIMHLPNFG